MSSADPNVPEPGSDPLPVGPGESDLVLNIEHLSKTFGGTRALDGVSFSVRPGEVHALVGHNGSGKSTLIKTLAGYHRADAGARAWLDSQPFDMSDLGDARHESLRFVHQELGLVVEMSALENLALHGGFAMAAGRRVDWKTQERRAVALLRRFGESLDVHRPLSEATPVERVVVAVAASLQGWHEGRGILVLDEPTAVLPPDEVARLFQIVREVKASGKSVIYVSHRLDEIFEICDRVTVLRGGVLVDTVDVKDTDKARLVQMMLGDEVAANFASSYRASPTGPVALRCSDARSNYLDGVDLTVHQGEIVGLAGRRGSGREELPYVLAGLPVPMGSAAITAPDGTKVEHGLVPGVVLLPEDRGAEGVIAAMSVMENLTLSVLGRLGRRGHLNRRTELSRTKKWLDDFNVDRQKMNSPISELSGGNQQKVLFGRCLVQNPRVLILCEPTAGVDIGTRNALYELVETQAAAGLSVVVSSSDIGDLVSVCTRVVVFDGGRIVSELSGSDITEAAIVREMEGTSV